MDDNKIENTNSDNGDKPNQDLEGLDEAALKEVTIKERGEKTELEGKNKQLFERAKKAEGFELKDGEWIKTEIKEPKVEKKSDADKSDELNEGQVALLSFKGYDDSADIAYIQGEMKESGKTLTEVIEMKYVQEALGDLKKAREVQEATPEGSKRSHSSARDTVEYWTAKGEMPENTFENTELRRKIVNAQIANEKNKSKFTDDPVIRG